MIFSHAPSLAPVSPERLTQLVTRLFLHFRCPPGEAPPLVFRRYLQALQPYPEDLLCAAYQHMLIHHSSRLPEIAELLSFMAPEMAHRHRMQEA